ncbi:peptide deformylase [Salininema proteolyticum]|uniref:Peptide deformylase n=1 Tax=Salininema proteolyticum TaxID=1607685 RepID=A0ABV8TUI8_9ACTN
MVQHPDPILSSKAGHFELPDDRKTAMEVIDKLTAAAAEIARVHDFAKGMGVAAPQIGLAHAAAVVYQPGKPEPIVLLNPTIIESSSETDLQYEGCLSFFDVRCRVPRPRQIHVEHVDLEGQRHITVFDDGLARLVAHEIDHLDGILCLDRLPAGESPIPVKEYKGTGATWSYK